MVVTLLPGILLTGCFTLTPVRIGGDVDPGRVRLHLNDSGVAHLSTLLGTRERVMDAELVGTSGDDLLVRVPSVGRAGFGSEVLYQEIRLPTRELEGVQRRTLNRTRTALVVGGVGAVAGILLFQTLSGKTGGDVPGPYRGPPSRAYRSSSSGSPRGPELVGIAGESPPFVLASALFPMDAGLAARGCARPHR